MNGSFVEGKDAMVSVFDAGFQHGVGLFETMIARNGHVFVRDDTWNDLLRLLRCYD